MMRFLATAVMGTLLVSGRIVAPMQQVGAPDPRVFGLALQLSLEALASQEAPIAVVAEDARVDSAVVAWGGPAMRLQQDRIQVAAALESGVSVIAGPMGRAHLELLGFRLTRVAGFGTPSEFSWSRVTGELTCTEVSSDRWSQLPGLEYTGRVGFEIPQGGGELVIIVADDLPLAVRGALADGEALPLTLEPLPDGTGERALPRDYWFNTTETRTMPAYVGRLRVPANRSAGRYVGIQLGRRGPRVLARLEGYGGSTLGNICAAPLQGEPLAAAGLVEIPLSRDAWMGTGWSGVERDREGALRRISGSAAMLLASGPGHARRITVDAMPASPAPQAAATIAVVVNGRRFDAKMMRDGTARYAWDVPPQSWTEGTNELLLVVSTAAGPTEVLVRRVAVDFGI